MSRVSKILSLCKPTPVAGLFSLLIAALVAFGLALELDPDPRETLTFNVRGSQGNPVWDLRSSDGVWVAARMGDDFFVVNTTTGLKKQVPVGPKIEDPFFHF